MFGSLECVLPERLPMCTVGRVDLAGIRSSSSHSELEALMGWESGKKRKQKLGLISCSSDLPLVL